jgi:hypothetical protein
MPRAVCPVKYEAYVTRVRGEHQLHEKNNLRALASLSLPSHTLPKRYICCKTADNMLPYFL